MSCFLELLLLLNSPRFESISESDLLSSLKIAEVAIIFDLKFGSNLNSSAEHELIRSFFKAFLWFIFQDFILPLIKFNFYVTESSSVRTKLFFYRHEAWNRISAQNMDDNLDSMFTPTEATQIMAKLRLVPKENGKFRPIIAFKRNPNSVRQILFYPSINFDRKKETVFALLFMYSNTFTSTMKAFP